MRLFRRLTARLRRPLSVPLFYRFGFHFRRITQGVDSGFYVRLLCWLAGIVIAAALIVTLAEAPDYRARDLSGKYADTFYWGVTTVMGAGDASYVTTPVGYVVSWLLVLFGVAIVAAVTGALVGFVIDFMLKEGQGMGAAGYRDHVVVCGWNPTARELIAELTSDEYDAKVVLIHDSDKNPAGHGVYFVNGDITNADDLRRAGIEEAMSAVVCPLDNSNEADMKSILCVLAIESIAPQVRTVAEVNNPAHVDHFKRADVDEVLVTSRMASRLLARTSLYSGLSELVTDIVSGGQGSELYRIGLPDDYTELTVDQLSAKLRADHTATLLAIARNSVTVVNPPPDYELLAGDDAVVVAESLRALHPLTAREIEAIPNPGDGEDLITPQGV